MSEEKRNLVEGLLRGANAAVPTTNGGHDDGAHDEEKDISDVTSGVGEFAREERTVEEALQSAESAALAESVTEKLRGLGFGDADVAAAMAATHPSSSRLLRDSNAALDWLCLNVPEARLPRRFAPSAKNEPIVLMDTAAAFAPAGTGARRKETKGDEDDVGRGTAGGDDDATSTGFVFDEPRPVEPAAARLYDFGYALQEIRDALAESAGDERKAHESLFRAVLNEAAPRDDAWASWPGEPSATSDVCVEDDPWEEEMIAVEAIAGEEAFERVSPSLIAVTVESAVGRARLEVARPKSNAYPGAAPPLVSLAAADAAAPPPRGALRAATAALAAAAAAAAEDGATCVYELMSLAPTALEEHATKPSPRSTSLSSSNAPPPFWLRSDRSKSERRKTEGGWKIKRTARSTPRRLFPRPFARARAKSSANAATAVTARGFPRRRFSRRRTSA
jgi:hypothetical protein